MKKLIGWIALAALTTTVACSSDTADEPNVACERTTIDATDYCTYEQPITETGYDCPADLPHAISFEGHTVCSSEQQIPPEHQAPLREHIGESSSPSDAGRDADNVDPAVADLCTNPQAYDGQTITVPGTALKTTLTGPAILCPYPHADAGLDVGPDASRTCCSYAAGPMYIDCPYSPGETSPSSIVINPGPNSTHDFFCAGDNCGHTCDPAGPEGLVSITGIIHSANPPYSSDKSDYGPDHLSWSDYPAELEATDYQLTP